MNYNDFMKKMNDITMVNQLKLNYFEFRNGGYSCEYAYQFAKNKTYEQYIEFMLTSLENRNFSDVKNFGKLRQGYDIIKEEPIFLTQFLEDSYCYTSLKKEKTI